jgi:hypothetical protein
MAERTVSIADQIREMEKTCGGGLRQAVNVGE